MEEYMDMKKLFLISFVLLASVITMAQKPVAKFKNYSYDFGVIQEKEGKVTHIFEFTNIGKGVFLITEVTASCGCTTPKWSKKPIPPGGTGYINVTYNPKNRPGPFNKTITVTNNSEENKIQLIIKGDVAPDLTKKPKQIKENK